jgi:hypothetical protein
MFGMVEELLFPIFRYPRFRYQGVDVEALDGRNKNFKGE